MRTSEGLFMDSVMKQKLVQEKKAFDALGFNCFTDTDKTVSSYVASRLVDYNANASMADRTYQLSQAIDLSSDDLMLFGEDYATKVKDIARRTKCIVAYTDDLLYSCQITYNYDAKKKEVVTNSGVVQHYKVPMHISELAPIFLGHEHIHSIKETNYQEYINARRVGDVIPLFYEFVIAKKNYQEIYKTWLNARMYLMSDSKKKYTRVRQIMKKEFKDKDLYKIIATRTGQYLNSFYYALILYHMYLADEKLIMGLVKKVLNHEMTTIELLNTLGIYGPNHKTMFEEELNSLKKSL